MTRRITRLAIGGCALGLSLHLALGAARADPPASFTAQAPPAPPLTLEAAVQQALTRNPQVTAAQQVLVAAQAGVITARAGLAPGVSLTGAGSYGTTGAGAATSLGVPIPAATPNPAGSVSVTGTLPLYDGGRTRGAVALAEAAVAAAGATLTQTRQDVGLQTATAFFSVLKAQRVTSVREAQLAQAQAQLAQTEAQFRAGTSAQADVIQAQAQVAQAQVDLLTARNQVDTLKVALRSVLALDVQSPVEVQEPSAPPTAVALTAAAAVSEALQSRPEVAEAVAAVQSNQASLDLAYVNAGVQVSVGLNATYTPYSTNTFLNNATGYAVTATVSLPLFDSGKGDAGINGAKATLNAAQARLDQARLTVRQDAYQAYLAAVQGAATITATAAAQEAADEALRVAEGRYQAGVATIVEVTTSRATAAQAEVNAVNARYDYATALATLRHALGRPIVGGSL